MSVDGAKSFRVLPGAALLFCNGNEGMNMGLEPDQRSIQINNCRV